MNLKRILVILSSSISAGLQARIPERLVLSALSLVVGTNAISSQEAQDDAASSISLPMKPCNEEFMKCLQDTTEVTSDGAFSISKSDSSTWGTFETYQDACGSITTEFTRQTSQLGNLICMMCGHQKYPSIYADCNDSDRRLAKDIWTVFEDHQKFRRRREDEDGPGSNYLRL